MLVDGRDTEKFFNKVPTPDGGFDYVLKTDAEYAQYLYQQQIAKKGYASFASVLTITLALYPTVLLPHYVAAKFTNTVLHY